MRPRLMRNQNERVIAGVCGGLGDYFGVDPVIVRLVFVLVGFATGIGLFLYPILWIAMPKSNLPPAPPQLGADGEPVSASVRARVAATNAPRASYVFDPYTGEPLPPNVGETQHLDLETPNATPPRRAPILGIILVGIGLMGIASAIDIPATYVLPVLMIIGGVLLLRRR